jgi:choline dehydrogenase-like flavoprotein
MTDFDYVILGGGSAGCALAGRLSEDPRRRVCLLEAGDDGTSWMVSTPAAVLVMAQTRRHMYPFETDPQAGLNGRRGYQPRGACLGGSSAVNAMVYTRGHAIDYDGWAALGNPGWSYAEVLPYFKRSENNETIQDDFHGVGGPLNVALPRTGNPFQQIFLDAARQAGFRLSNDFNGADQEGAGVYQVTQRNGERWSAARGYIHANLGRPNLSVITGARARRVLLDGTRATGVLYAKDGRDHTVHAAAEVIVCAGALQTPQILMLSGIGDGEALRRFSIPVVAHLPGVGANLQDHIDFTFGYRLNNLDLFGLSFGGACRALREIARYRRDRTGMITSNYAEAGAFLKTDPSLAAPDLQLHFVTGIVENHGRKLRRGHGYSCHVCWLRPKSRGTVGLASPDPFAPPRIDPNFYGDPDDLDGMVRSFKLTRRILQAPAFADLRPTDLFTAGVESDDEIRQSLRDRSDTVYHPAGSCRMGSDPMAVVDATLRVHGLQRLRIADASIMPTLVGGNTNAPCVMIGEKAADLIITAA